jgi:hypothetical protein
MILNLAEKDPAVLLSNLYSALRDGRDKTTIELLGPGMMLHDTALMLFEVLRKRPPHLQLHMHSHTCLSDGALLVWLAGNTRTIRGDAWIQLSPIPETPGFFPAQPHAQRSGGLPVEEEQPADTDLRTVIRHLNEWLPVGEVAGLRLFESDIRDLGLLEDSEGDQSLAALFGGSAHILRN